MMVTISAIQFLNVHVDNLSKSRGPALDTEFQNLLLPDVISAHRVLMYCMLATNFIRNLIKSQNYKDTASIVKATSCSL
jgi:hypothetical protein